MSRTGNLAVVHLAALSELSTREQPYMIADLLSLVPTEANKRRLSVLEGEGYTIQYLAFGKAEERSAVTDWLRHHMLDFPQRSLMLLSPQASVDTDTFFSGVEAMMTPARRVDFEQESKALAQLEEFSEPGEISDPHESYALWLLSPIEQLMMETGATTLLYADPSLLYLRSALHLTLVYPTWSIQCQTHLTESESIRSET